MTGNVTNKTGFVVIGAKSGYTVVAKQSPLKRLNYFDGKFLRAPDLKLEQQSLLNQVRLSNQAGGSGVVHGYDCTLGGGDQLNISGGLAIDGHGRILQMADSISVGVGELIENSRADRSTSNKVPAKTPTREHGKAAFADCVLHDIDELGQLADGGDLYLITVCHVEVLCGEEDVYGKLCESACVSSTERPYLIEGVSIRALPLNLSTLYKTSNAVSLSQKHLRSRLASAFFEQERQHPASHISKEGLGSNVWCLGAEAATGDCVPIAVVSRSAGTTLFLDAWTARRERMESPPRHYWASVMAMRPWHVFLAQVLQFQCQLRKCLADGGAPTDGGPCAEERTVARKAAADLKVLMARYELISARFAAVDGLAKDTQPFALADIRQTHEQLVGISSFVLPSRLLINRCGIVELPSAGYLPVNNSDTMTINEQVRRMLGEGVDLRFCVVRADYIPHALEEAQHMERICLLQGLDDPNNKPRVDILVPDGRIEAFRPEVEGSGYEMALHTGGDDLLSDASKMANDNGAVAGSDFKSTSNGAGALFDGFQFNFKQIIAARAMKRVDGVVAEQPAGDSSVALRGAARGEVLESGGYSFYFAGRMPQLVRQVVTSLASIQILQQEGDAVLAQANTDDSAASSPVVVEEMLARNKRAKDIEMKILRLNRGQRINTNQKESAPIYDMWLSMRTEQDPFKLARSGITNISAELVIMISVATQKETASAVIEVTQNGTLTVEEIISTGSEARRRCAINSNGMVNIQVKNGAQDTAKTVPLKLIEQLYISRENDGSARPTFKLDVPALSFFDKWDSEKIDIDVGFQFTRSWSSAENATLAGIVTYLLRSVTDGVASAANGQLQTREGSLPIFSGAQRINPDVLKPDNLFHDTSLTALREIGDSRTADSRALQLFPPPQPAPDELQVYGSRDWVLFHRCRDISCGKDKVPEVVVKPLRYRLYYISILKTKGDFEILRKGLLENNGAVISRYQPIASSIVEYDAGLQSVRTSHTNLRNDWQALVNNPNAEIIMGAIASQGAAFDEGQAMAELRLDSVGDVLAPITPLDEDVELFTLPKVPDVLAGGDVDGVIVMATVPVQDVVTACHEVYRAELTGEEDFKALTEVLKGSDFRTVLNGDDRIRRLGRNAIFVDGQSDFSGDSKENVSADWLKEGNNIPVRGVLLVVSEGGGTTPTMPTDQPYVQQLIAIANVAGASTTQFPLVSRYVSGGLDECSAITVLVVYPVVGAIIENWVVADLASAGDSSDAVVAVHNKISFNENGEVVRDAELEAAILKLKEEQVMIRSIDMVSAEATTAADPKMEFLLAELKKEGVAMASATINMRQPTATEKKLINASGAEVRGGFVLNR
ncbi:MAG: hypothetical protein GXP10_10340 [Gammaproteobacteria bacterium]|nr:hypothetical protein [Gammaproteobacteria bacterium]